MASVVAVASADYGIDWSCWSDLDPYARTSSGVDVVKEAAFRRLISPPDSLLGDPFYGFDVAGSLSGSGTAATMSGAIAGQIRTQLLRDERIELVVIKNQSFNATTGALEIAVECTTGIGPFEFVFSLSQAGIELITT